jgi:Trypsin-like peptidase domain
MSNDLSISRIILLATSIWLGLVSSLVAQDAVPSEILQRTVFIQVENKVGVKIEYSRGTAFMIDHQDKLYLVTAKHVIAKLPIGKATLQWWRSNKWEDLQIVKTLFPASADVDIAVMETEEKVSQPFQIRVPIEDEGPTMGQQVWFLGYPSFDVENNNLTVMSHFENQQILPFIKKGTMSAVDASNANAVMLYIDGFNNSGFSGGPIIYWDFKQRAYRIIGVVMGYISDTAKIRVNGNTIKSDVLINSGILIGYSAMHAVEAIKEDKKR